MCNACSKWYNALPDAPRAPGAEFQLKQMPMQSELNPAALARFARARGIADTGKLDAMLPAWIKAHNRATYPSARAAFVPDQPARFPVSHLSGRAMPSSLAHVGRIVIVEFGMRLEKSYARARMAA